MITEIHVDGYKSLNNFRLGIKKGLNILVGPNGSGKTNIISFFEFLSYLADYELHQAVSRNGGAGSIFSKKGDIAFNDTIEAKIFGCRKYNEKRFVHYHYTFSIKVDAVAGQLFYEYQHLQIRLSNERKSISKKNCNVSNWDFDIEVRYDNSNKRNNHQIVIKQLDRRKIKNRFSEKFSREEIVKRIQSFYSRKANRNLIQLLGMELDTIRPIMMDLLGGEVFNIIPSKVKLPEDIAKQPGIGKDGSGVASTLYAIKNDRFYSFGRSSYLYSRPKKLNTKVFEQIVELTKLANDSIVDLTVSNNPFDNQLVVKVTIENRDGPDIILPISSMSDGTIKWISLITAILSSSQLFSIEEPENFLHPWMQSEIIKIMRNSFENKKYESFVLMSTHSETLINSADPNEIIVVSMNKGNTVVKRVTNIKLLREEIEATGFGLGYYYLTGALNND